MAGSSPNDLTPWARGLMEGLPFAVTVPATGTVGGDHPDSYGSPRGHYSHNSIDVVPVNPQDESAIKRWFESQGAYVQVEGRGTKNYHLHIQPPRGGKLLPSMTWAGG